MDGAGWPDGGAIGAAAADAAAIGPVVWLTGEYAKVSHTFIRREVAGLRALGFDLRVASVRPVAPEHLRDEAARAEAARTFHVLPAALRPGSLLAHAAAIRRAPRTWARTLAAAWRTAAPGVGGRLRGLAYFHEAAVLARELRRIGAVHLHNHFAMSSGAVARLAAPLAGVSHSFTVHGPDELALARRWRLDDRIAAAAFVACISHFARSQAMLHAPPAQWGKLHVVHCGVEPARYARPRAPVQGRLLFVGRLAAAKGVPVLLDALRIARRARPDLHLALAGDGPDRAALEAQARALGGAASFLGFRNEDEVSGLLATAEALVLPSFAEGVPVVLMEALAAGVPVVATRIAGIAELVEDGRSGRLVPPGDEDALARAILEVAGGTMDGAGRARVAAEFDARREAARLARLLVWARTGGPRPARRPEPWPGGAA